MRNRLLTKWIMMEQIAYELFIKYKNTDSPMSKNAAKRCAYLELEGSVEERSVIPGAEMRIHELEEIKMKVLDI